LTRKGREVLAGALSTSQEGQVKSKERSTSDARAGKKVIQQILAYTEKLLVCCLASLTTLATVSSYLPRPILIKT
jgi:hypothetical protein